MQAKHILSSQSNSMIRSSILLNLHLKLCFRNNENLDLNNILANPSSTNWIIILHTLSSEKILKYRIICHGVPTLLSLSENCRKCKILTFFINAHIKFTIIKFNI